MTLQTQPVSLEPLTSNQSTPTAPLATTASLERLTLATKDTTAELELALLLQLMEPREKSVRRELGVLKVRSAQPSASSTSTIHSLELVELLSVLRAHPATLAQLQEPPSPFKKLALPVTSVRVVLRLLAIWVSTVLLEPLRC